MSSGGSHYDVLGVKHDASTADIMTAYNDKVQKVFGSGVTICHYNQPPIILLKGVKTVVG